MDEKQPEPCGSVWGRPRDLLAEFPDHLRYTSVRRMTRGCNAPHRLGESFARRMDLRLSFPDARSLWTR